MQAGYTSAPFESSGSGALEGGVAWLVALSTGSLAIGLCVLAVALVGLLMFAGRLPVREGLRVVLGCFVLLGAPAIAAGFISLSSDRDAGSIGQEREPVAPTRPELPPSTYDPYAGASLRQD